MKIALLTTDNREDYRVYDALEPRLGTAPAALLQGFARLPDLEVHVVCCTQRPLNSPEKLAPNIWFHSLLVPKLGWLRTGYQGCVRAVRRRLRAIHPDLAHGQGTERDCAINAVFSGYPSVLTIHGNMRLIARVNRARPFTFHWIMAQLERLTIPRSNGVVCITNYTRQAVADLAPRTWVVPNAVDASFFEIERHPAPSGTVLCVGNISVRKNQNAFIRALDASAPETGLRMLFYGAANRGEPYVEEFFELLKSRPWCVYGGFADRDALKEQFKTATMLALPSLEDNCPMVLLEAMAAGMPVVAAKVGGIPELIQEGRTGYFCDPLMAASMAGAVTRIRADPPAAQAMAARAREIAQERFHPSVIARRHVEIYREVLGAAASSPS